MEGWTKFNDVVLLCDLRIESRRIAKAETKESDHDYTQPGGSRKTSTNAGNGTNAGHDCNANNTAHCAEYTIECDGPEKRGC